MAPFFLPVGIALTLVSAGLRARTYSPARIFFLGFAAVAFANFTGQIVLGWTFQVIVLSIGVIERIRSLAAEKQRAEIRNEELHRLAYIDPLTGARNRIAFDEDLRRELESAREAHEMVALFFADLDGFKAVNDSYGHHYGDLVLQIVADRLKNAVRASDGLARLGGDEFALITRATPETARQIQAQISAVLDEPIVVNRYRISHLGVSVGTALFPRDGSTADELLAAADRDMYRMKESSRTIAAGRYHRSGGVS